MTGDLSTALPNTASSTAPAVLLPYQQRWLADQSPLKVEEKSRRTGLTWAEAADDVLIAAADASAGGMNVYYIAYNQDMTIEFIQAAAMWARVFNRAAGEIEEGFWEEDEEDKQIKTYTIRFPASGFRIVALSSRPSNLRGRQGVIVIDEAAFHEQLDALLKAAMAMLIWGGKVRVISTHNGTDNPFNQLIDDIRAGRRKGSVQRITFRDAVAEGLYKRVCLRLGKPWSQAEEAAWMQDVYAFYGDGAAEELDVIPADGGGAWLSRALVESRMSADTPVLRWECKKGFELLPEQIRRAECQDWLETVVAPVLEALPKDARRSFIGGDFGRSGDLSVDLPLLEFANLQRRVPFVIELRNVPFRQQEQIAFWVIDRLPHFSGGAFDARGNGQYLAEVVMQRYGAARIAQVMLTESWYREHMPPVKAALEDGDLVDLPKDDGILSDFRAVQIIRGVARVPDTKNTDAAGQRHGDAAIAAALAYFASRTMDGLVIAPFEPAPAHPAWGADNDDTYHRSTPWSRW
ncbi:Mu-like prophage FluMu protein gp28 [Thiomonas sp. CB3]|nr:Mu-like prophage FluMu protein gp28 [Thiomonas sp. CB3]